MLRAKLALVACVCLLLGGCTIIAQLDRFTVEQDGGVDAGSPPQDAGDEDDGGG